MKKRGTLMAVAAACLAVLVLCPPTLGRADEAFPSSRILHEIRDFRETGSVLYIGAHPDDENNQLLAYLARGRGYRTAYLSLTRGEGGQNLIGPEQGEALGVLRTQELVAARRVDGARQFFTSAIDFGFTRDFRESFRIWDRQRVLGEVVRVIRTFRPDVVITRFSPEPGTTHGHHTASAMLALEAFGLAADSKAFPEQLSGLSPWQARRILWNNGPGPAATAPKESEKAGAILLETGGYDPLLGESYGEIGARSRSMHRSQGMGRSASRGSRTEYFKMLKGEPTAGDPFDGIPTAWDRFPGGERIHRLADEAVSHFNAQDPAASVPVLLKLKDFLTGLPADAAVAHGNLQLNRILQACLGLHVETVVAEGRVVPGEVIKLKHSAITRSAHPIRWRGVRYPSVKREAGEESALTPFQPAVRELNQALPADASLSQPYWLREKGSAGMYLAADPECAGLPECRPVFPVEHVFELDGHSLTVEDVPVQILVDPAKGETRRPLEVIPVVSLDFDHDLELFAPGSSRTVRVELVPARGDVAGNLQLEAPAGWTVKPASRAFKLGPPGVHAEFDFTVVAPPRPAVASIAVTAVVDGVRHSRRRMEIRHEGIATQPLLPSARIKVVGLPLVIRGQRVGYLPGSGDFIAESLRKMGYEVTILDDTDLRAARLRRFDAVVVGVRALNVRTGLDRRMPALFDYVRSGGNLLMQYNTPDGLQVRQPAPYELTLSLDRVTDPAAPVKVLVPRSPAFVFPNRIGPEDFEGWVQERGRNFPSAWDAHFTPLLGFNDADGSPRNGALLVAPFGRGHFIYTGLSLFRQLPEGVPGAFRLFANLLALGSIGKNAR